VEREVVEVAVVGEKEEEVEREEVEEEEEEEREEEEVGISGEVLVTEVVGIAEVVVGEVVGNIVVVIIVDARVMTLNTGETEPP
jgi:hypothetical protein